MLKAGAAKVDISPRPGVALAGGFRPVVARSVHDPLHCRALVLDDGRCPLALATCDLIVIQREDVLRVKEEIRRRIGLPPEQVMLAATHTHSAPAPAGLLGTDREDAYMDWALPRMAEAVVRAWQARRPARAGWGTGEAPGHVFNRRFRMKDGTVRTNPGSQNPDALAPVGPVDPQVALLAVVDGADGSPLAAVGNYALHYVGGVGPGHVSADYFACVEQAVNGLMGADFPLLWTNGFCGDVNNNDVFRPREPAAPYERMRSVAASVGQAAEGIWRGMEFAEEAPLAAALADLPVRRRVSTPEELEQARAVMAHPAGEDDPGRERAYAREALLLADWPEEEVAPVQALRVGGLGIAALPGEMFAEYGLDIKRRSPFAATMAVELANGYAGYLPAPKAFEEGGYETRLARSSRLAPQAGPAMCEKALELLMGLHDAPPARRGEEANQG